MDTLVNRLRGQYEIGDNNEFGTRSFSNFIPPISLEAEDRIEKLETALNNLLNDCINFDGGKLTDFVMEEASKELRNYVPEE